MPASFAFRDFTDDKTADNPLFEVLTLAESPKRLEQMIDASLQIGSVGN